MQWEYFGGAAPAPFNSQLSSPLSSLLHILTCLAHVDTACTVPLHLFPDACCMGLVDMHMGSSVPSVPSLLSRHVAGMTVSSGLEPPMLVARDRGVLANTDALQWRECGRHCPALHAQNRQA